MSLVSKRKLQALGVQMFKQTRRNLLQRGRGKKTIPQDIVELLEDMTMVDYEVTTLKKDFDDLLEGTERRHSSRRLDLSPKYYHPSSSWPNFSFGGSRRTLGIDLPRGCQPLSFWW
jgi:hypothetical protein